MRRDRLRRICLTFLAAGCATVLTGCTTPRDIRIENVSDIVFHDVRIFQEAYGEIRPGETTDYKTVDLKLRDGILRLTADGHEVNAQTLNFGAERFTYRVGIKDLEAGHLGVEVVRDSPGSSGDAKGDVPSARANRTDFDRW